MGRKEPALGFLRRSLDVAHGPARKYLQFFHIML
jgi:hypothetical protein